MLFRSWKSGAFKNRISGCIGQAINNKESLPEASIRITKELTGLKLNPEFLQLRALLNFIELDNSTGSALMLGDVYKEHQLYYDGDNHMKIEHFKENPNLNVLLEIKETELFIPQWYEINKIPYSEMPDDDIHWYKLFLDGNKLEGEFTFNGTKLEKYEVNIVKELKL